MHLLPILRWKCISKEWNKWATSSRVIIELVRYVAKGIWPNWLDQQAANCIWRRRYQLRTNFFVGATALQAEQEQDLQKCKVFNPPHWKIPKISVIIWDISYDVKQNHIIRPYRQVFLICHIDMSLISKSEWCECDRSGRQLNWLPPMVAW